MLLLLLCFQIRWRKQQLHIFGKRKTSDECHDFAVDFCFGWAGGRPHQVSFVTGPMQPWNRAYWIAFAALDEPARRTWRGDHQYSAQEFSRCMLFVYNCTSCWMTLDHSIINIKSQLTSHCRSFLWTIIKTTAAAAAINTMRPATTFKVLLLMVVDYQQQSIILLVLVSVCNCCCPNDKLVSR